MYLKLNSDKTTFQTIVEELRNFENGLVFSSNIDNLSINISPSENIILKVIELSNRENITIKFVFICTGTEFDVEDWQTATRVYCGYFEKGKVYYLKHDNFNNYPQKKCNEFYGFVSYVFEDYFDINFEVQFEVDLDFFKEINQSKYKSRLLVFDKIDIYQHLMSGYESPRIITQLHETSAGYYINNYNIDRGEIPIYVKSNHTPQIINTEPFINKYDSSKTIMFFDLETNGLPKKNRVNYIEDWPDIVQISWSIYKLSGELIDIGNEIIKPFGFQINKESEDIHGISQKMALTKGKSFAEVIDIFIHKMRCANIVVAHNLEFDLTVLITSVFKYELRTEDDKHYLDNFFLNGKITWSFYQLQLLFKYLGDDRFPSNAYFITNFKNNNDRIFYCTMIESSNCIFDDDKWRTLNDLYKKLFGQIPHIPLHNSLNDIWITKQSFYEIYKIGSLKFKSKPFLLKHTLYNEIESYYNLSDKKNREDDFPL